MNATPPFSADMSRNEDGRLSGDNAPTVLRSKTRLQGKGWGHR